MQVASSIERLGGQIALAHTVEVLDASIRGLPVESLGSTASRSAPSPPIDEVSRCTDRSSTP
jgi:glycolate oxidase iron-sulfur subunit